MSKPDDRRDNARKIKKTIEDTKQNIELGEEMIAITSDPKTKASLRAKNERRLKAIEPMQREMNEESKE